MTRLELTDYIIKDLGCCTDWYTVTGNLVAIALLKQLSVESLMDLYLQSRLVIFYFTKTFNQQLRFFRIKYFYA